MSKTALQWMAVYTKPRSEKKVAERLDRYGYEVFCPLQTTIRQWSDRKKKIQVPIFPSYVFIKVNEKMRSGVLEDPGVLNFVFYLGKPAIIREEEIEAIRIFHDSGRIEEATVRQYQPGEKVDIVAGVFRGTKGEFVEQKMGKVSLLVESLGMVVKISLSAKYVQS